ncbi:DNA-directed RNA polymerase III subunit RPC7-like [Denticeps clupeoides]|uniref:DNA-directed RNA polymerase III subunit RPC7-like n=1 Tax=Denticeps clupeoides TaxID=299321 RepID=UPI0010A578AA|nr:DNA-directed RNA polymerase III subunit RPC7-like [Denticeps clupeoides]
MEEVGTSLFPPMEHKPVPLLTGKEAEYMLALKQEFRGAMKRLPFYIKSAASKKDVERYSDKYQRIEASKNVLKWSPDWRRLPEELCSRVKRPLKEKMTARPKHTFPACKEDEEIMRKLEMREREEEGIASDEEEEEKKTEEDEEEEYDEEESEEETGYIMSHLENEDDFGEESDYDVDEAIF